MGRELFTSTRKAPSLRRFILRHPSGSPGIPEPAPPQYPLILEVTWLAIQSSPTSVLRHAPHVNKTPHCARDTSPCLSPVAAQWHYPQEDPSAPFRTKNTIAMKIVVKYFRCANTQPFLCNELGSFQAVLSNFQAILGNSGNFRQSAWAPFR